MRTTLDLDDQLLARAREYTGSTDDADVVRKALVALVQREAARLLARQGGGSPDLAMPPRRRIR